MKIENPEYINEPSPYEDGEEETVSVVLPKGLPGKRGAKILMVGNLKYFLEMYTPDDDVRYVPPYEILAELEKQVMKDVAKGEVACTYLIDYRRPDQWSETAYIIFDFSHFEVNTETEPDENYRSLYIYFDFTCSAS